MDQILEKVTYLYELRWYHGAFRPFRTEGSFLF